EHEIDSPLPGSLLMTAVLTGTADSTVELADFAGTKKIVEPLSVSKAVLGTEVYTPVHIGSVAPNLLQKIAPQLAKLSMPPALH
ncbi:MAG: hypothetical protein D3924_03295, partial [Candidatus Electrothrix sp. AR4]|nr:hypothetical protein [Candidatus Electrothrix sp. AR4]